MSPRKCTVLACGLLGIATATACTSGSTAPSHVASHQVASHHVASGATPPSPQPVTRADARRCPKTIPRHIGPPGTSPAGIAPQTGTYGNGKLWVTLDMRGVIVASGDMVHPDGWISWKFPWWRMIAGHLTITGRRLDAPALPLMSTVPSGYGNIGFQASGVTFPSEGCWQITGKIAHSSLTFVAFVITKAHRAAISSGR